MANKRDLKKSIQYICNDLLADCVALSLCEGCDRGQIDALMAETLHMLRDFTSRIGHCEKGKERIFYQKLRADFTEKANSLAERIAKV